MKINMQIFLGSQKGHVMAVRLFEYDNNVVLRQRIYGLVEAFDKPNLEMYNKENRCTPKIFPLSTLGSCNWITILH